MFANAVKEAELANQGDSTEEERDMIQVKTLVKYRQNVHEWRSSLQSDTGMAEITMAHAMHMFWDGCKNNDRTNQKM